MKSIELACGLFLVVGLVQPISSGWLEDRNLWASLRTNKCNEEVIDAWQELAGRSEAETMRFSKKHVDVMERVATITCPKVADMEKKFEQSKGKVDKSALEPIQELLSDDLIKRYKEKTDRAPSGFYPLKSFMVIESRFRNILEKEIMELPKTSFKIVRTIDKYIFSACAKYNAQMAETIKKLKRISLFLAENSYTLQNEKVKNDYFRFEWCKPFTIKGLKGESKKLLSEEFDQTEEVKEQWKLLVRAEECNGMVTNAWFELLNRPNREIRKFSPAEVKLLERIAMVTCPDIADVGEEFVERRKKIEEVDKSALDIEQLLGDEVIMKLKTVYGQMWHEPGNSKYRVDWSFFCILNEEPAPLKRSKREFEKVMNKYIYTPCAKYNRQMHWSLAKLDRITRFVSIERQIEAVQNGWYRFKWCQQINTDVRLKFDIEYQLFDTFRNHRKRNFESDNSKISMRDPTKP